MRNTLIRNRRWILAFAVVAAISILAVFAPSWSASAAEDPPASQAFAPNAQILNDDLKIEEGDIYEGDVVVYDGDVEVREGGQILGNLVVYSGDIKIQEGGEVAGDVSAFSGDIELEGRVDGNISSWSGDIELKDTAYVAGDISVLSGDIERDDGAYVGGNVVQGPSLKLPGAVPSLAIQPDQLASDTDRDAGRNGLGFFGSIGRFVGRLFSALIFMVVVGLFTTGIAAIRPSWVDEIERNVRTQAALSFVVGFMVNIGLALLTLVLVITICLWPIPLLTLIGINLIGWTGISQVVGRYVSRLFGLNLQPAIVVGLGAAVLIGVLAPFWAMGGCLRFIVWLIMFVLGAMGTGAFLLPWLNRWRAGEPILLPPTRPDGGTPEGSTLEQPASEPSVDVEDAVIVSDPAPASLAETTEVPPATGRDDLTAIAGIGPVFEKRLNAAGVRTFAQLAAMSPQQVADVIGWSVERVIKSELIEQARQLAG